MLKYKLISAASLTVLMAAGLAACSKSDTANTKTAEADQAKEETTDSYAREAGEAAQDSADYAQNTLAEDPVEEDPSVYANDMKTAADDALNDTTADADGALGAMKDKAGGMLDKAAERAETALNDATPDATPSLAALTPMQVSDVRSKDDIPLIAESSFDLADENRDGVLDREEFAKMSMASVSQEASLADKAIDAAGDKAAGMVEKKTGVDAGGAIDALTDDDPVIAEATINEAFAQAAGDDAAMTREELRETFLARFEIADINGNDQLEEEERETFAALSAGKK